MWTQITPGVTTTWASISPGVTTTWTRVVTA